MSVYSPVRDFSVEEIIRKISANVIAFLYQQIVEAVYQCIHLQNFLLSGQLKSICMLQNTAQNLRIRLNMLNLFYTKIAGAPQETGEIGNPLY